MHYSRQRHLTTLRCQRGQQACSSACHQVFPSVPVFGCFFHYKQSMWRRISELGLSIDYNTNAQVKRELKIIQFLAFVPVDHVIDLFVELKAALGDDTDSRVLDFYDYFESNYIGKEVTVAGRRGRGYKTVTSRPPGRFPIELWSIHSRLSQCLPRTNNFTEAWHGAFLLL